MEPIAVEKTFWDCLNWQTVLFLTAWMVVCAVGILLIHKFRARRRPWLLRITESIARRYGVDLKECCVVCDKPIPDPRPERCPKCGARIRKGANSD